MSFTTRAPASGPGWLPEFRRSVEALFRRVMPAPFRLWRSAAAGLPDASTDNEGGLVYDLTDRRVSYSDGSGWIGLQDYDSGLAAIAGLSADGLIARTGAGTAAARTITAGAGIAVDHGDGVSANPRIACTVTQYADEAARDAVGTILADSSTIDFTYDAGAPSIAAEVRDDSVTYAKIQNVSAADRLLGRSSPGAGDVEEIACTAFARNLLDDADAAAARATLAAAGTGAAQTFTAQQTVAAANVPLVVNSTNSNVNKIELRDAGTTRGYFGANAGNHLVVSDGGGVPQMSVQAARTDFNMPVRVRSYTVAGLPSASTAGTGAMIYVSNESGGAVIAFSDGTNWRRVTDRVVVS